MVWLVGVDPALTSTVVPFTVKLLIESALSTSRSLLRTLPELVTASSITVMRSAVKTESSSTASMLIVNL